MSLGFRYAAVGTIALVLLLGGTSVYAYESPEVSEGHFLHPVKQGIEQLEGKLRQGEPEGRAGHHLKMFGRRLDEADLQEVEEHKEILLETAAEELDMTVEELKDSMFDPGARVEILEQLDVENGRFLKMAGPPPGMLSPPMLEHMHEIGSDILENEDMVWEEKHGQIRERMRENWNQLGSGRDTGY